jgi:hypothetical protein
VNTVAAVVDAASATGMRVHASLLFLHSLYDFMVGGRPVLHVMLCHVMSF